MLAGWVAMREQWQTVQVNIKQNLAHFIYSFRDAFGKTYRETGIQHL